MTRRWGQQAVASRQQDRENLNVILLDYFDTSTAKLKEAGVPGTYGCLHVLLKYQLGVPDTYGCCHLPLKCQLGVTSTYGILAIIM